MNSKKKSKNSLATVVVFLLFLLSCILSLYYVGISMKLMDGQEKSDAAVEMLDGPTIQQPTTRSRDDGSSSSQGKISLLAPEKAKSRQRLTIVEPNQTTIFVEQKLVDAETRIQDGSKSKDSLTNKKKNTEDGKKPKSVIAPVETTVVSSRNSNTSTQSQTNDKGSNYTKSAVPISDSPKTVPIQAAATTIDMDTVTNNDAATKSSKATPPPAVVNKNKEKGAVQDDPASALGNVTPTKATPAAAAAPPPRKRDVIDSTKKGDATMTTAATISADTNRTMAMTASATTTIHATNQNQNQNHTLLVKRKKDLPHFIIHMGPDKTGTTSIQSFFLGDNNIKLFDKDNYDPTLSKRTKNKEHKDLVGLLIGCLINFSRPPESSKVACNKLKKWKRQWDASLETIRDMGYSLNKNLILSTEDFRWSTLDTSDWKVFTDWVQQYYRLKVVLVYRRYFDWLISRYNEEWKPSGPGINKILKWPSDGGQAIPTFVNYLQWETNGTCIRNKKCEQYYRNRISKTMGNLTHPALEMKLTLERYNLEVQVLNFHGENLLESFFCDAVPNATRACKKAKKESTQERNKSHNRLAYDFIATAAHAQGLVKEGVARNTVKGVIREYQEVTLNKTSIDFPLACLNGTLLADFRRWSYAFEIALQPSIASSHDEAFDNAIAKEKFCNVDANKVLEDPSWRKIISSITADG